MQPQSVAQPQPISATEPARTDTDEDSGRARAGDRRGTQHLGLLVLRVGLGVVLVAHGLFDLATPYFGTKIVLDQLPAFASPQRLKLVVYPGGHMFYSRDASRQALRAEVEALIKQ